MRKTTILPVKFKSPVIRPGDSRLCSLGFEFLLAGGQRSGKSVLCADAVEQETMIRELLAEDQNAHLADGFSFWEDEIRFDARKLTLSWFHNWTFWTRC